LAAAFAGWLYCRGPDADETVGPEFAGFPRLRPAPRRACGRHGGSGEGGARGPGHGRWQSERNRFTTGEGGSGPRPNGRGSIFDIQEAWKVFCTARQGKRPRASPRHTVGDQCASGSLERGNHPPQCPQAQKTRPLTWRQRLCATGDRRNDAIVTLASEGEPEPLTEPAHRRRNAPGRWAVCCRREPLCAPFGMRFPARRIVARCGPTDIPNRITIAFRREPKIDGISKNMLPPQDAGNASTRRAGELQRGGRNREVEGVPEGGLRPRRSERNGRTQKAQLSILPSGNPRKNAELAPPPEDRGGRCADGRRSWKRAGPRDSANSCRILLKSSAAIPSNSMRHRGRFRP